MPGGHSRCEPPDPIPNSEVKPSSADDSVGFPHVKVGHCQAFKQNPDLIMDRGFFIGVISMFNQSDLEEIKKNISNRCNKPDCQIYMFDKLDSTNEYLKRRVKDTKVNSGDICIAGCQTHGKGRRGREWISPCGGNIYLSVCYDASNTDALKLNGMTLGLGVAVGLAIQEISGIIVQMKWPNDIYFNNKKMGGILVEEIHSNKKRYWIIGVGLNIQKMDKDPCSDMNPIGLIEIWKDAFSKRDQLLSRIIENLLDFCEIINEKILRDYLQLWSSHDLFLEKEIEIVREDGSIILGRGAGIDDCGRLMVKTSQGMKILDSSFVSARLVQ